MPGLLSNWHRPISFPIRRLQVQFDLGRIEQDQVLLDLLRSPHTRVTALDSKRPAHVPYSAFRYWSVSDLLSNRARLVHYELSEFYARGKSLSSLQQRLLIPWRKWLAGSGFTWQSCHPTLFVSTNKAWSTFHTDSSSGLFIQVRGRKRFFYADDDLGMLRCSTLPKDMPTPAQLSVMRSCLLRRKQLFWNQSRIPHWVVGESTVSISISIFHFGLRRGNLVARNEQRTRATYKRFPELAWRSEFEEIWY